MHYEQRASEKRDREMEARRRVERLYRIRPGEAGLLADERLYRDVRPKSEMEWAARRLREDLKFEFRTEDRTDSFERTVGDLLVLADPRGRGKIDFHVFRAQAAALALAPRRGRSKAAVPVGEFFILDQWSVDLETKFLARVARLAAAIREPRDRRRD